MSENKAFKKTNKVLVCAIVEKNSENMPSERNQSWKTTTAWLHSYKMYKVNLYGSRECINGDLGREDRRPRDEQGKAEE